MLARILPVLRSMIEMVLSLLPENSLFWSLARVMRGGAPPPGASAGKERAGGGEPSMTSPRGGGRSAAKGGWACWSTIMMWMAAVWAVMGEFPTWGSPPAGSGDAGADG